MASHLSRLLWLCFGLSGAAALACEMLWLRSAGLVLGTTVPTTATVLACYFAGLGLGAACARQASSRPVRLYGGLELGAGMGALWSLAVFWLLRHEATQGWLATTGIAGRVAAVALAILPTTLCLGATLPALGQALASVETVGRHGGLLYAINTLGGVLGAAAAGFGLPALVGVRASYGIAAGTSLLAGLMAIMIGDRHEKTAETASRTEKAGSSERRGRLRLVAAGTGALGLGLEVLWTRLFAQVLHNSVYSFTAVVLVFLLAIATGAALAALLLRRAGYRRGHGVGDRSRRNHRWAVVFRVLDGGARLFRHAFGTHRVPAADHDPGYSHGRTHSARVGNGVARSLGGLG